MVVTDPSATSMSHDDVSPPVAPRVTLGVASPDVRPAGSCPLCGQPSGLVDVFEFAARPDLPDAARFEVCGRCNYLFAGDVSASSYRRHYASVRNDGNHVIDDDGPDSQVRLQSGQIAALLGPCFEGRILDFGCGQGRLLRAIGERFPKAELYGHDVADFIRPAAAAIRFVPDLAAVDERFDLIVLSHVLEHLVGFEILGTLEGLLEPGGRLYVEVPDPLRYASCPRREFMYYFDRLHINHFGARAMRCLLEGFGLEPRRRGRYRFGYRDGHYPAMYHVATRAGDVVDDQAGETRLRLEEGSEGKLDVAYRDYRDQEVVRMGDTKRRLEAAGGAAGVLVYGAGDNFRRARRPGGPLHRLTLLAVMDRRARQMPSEPDVAFELPEVALSRFQAAPVVITTSQCAEEIAAAIRADWPARPIFFA